VGNPRETWWPARLDFLGGKAVACPLKWQSSGDMTAMAGVDALIRVPSASTRIDPGQVVHVMRL
jgi:molybdopterin biosynthesis enzyme